jgi:serine/threonine protein kinase
MVSGVDYIHTNNFGHLDLKVENLFLDENMLLRIGDFDFCSQDDSELHDLGTVDYRAPEVIDTQGKFKRAPADVYSMGICLFVFISQRSTPYRELDKNKRDKTYYILLLALQ